MQNESYVFTADNMEDVRKKKYNRWFRIGGFVVCTIGAIISIMEGNRLSTFSFSMFAVFYGLMLLPDRKQAPITLTINNIGFDLQNAECDKYHDWKEIKLAQFNGRYLDVFWGSSFRKSIDLHMFAANDQVEILRLAGKFLSQNDVFILERNPTGQVFA